MKPESRQALGHVAMASCLCVATVYTGVFEGVFVQVAYEHYAEAPVASLPDFLAMPFNSLIILAYVLLGVYWLQRNASTPERPAEVQRARYVKDVFTSMAPVHGLVQWMRIGTQTRSAAVLDQWFTCPSLRGQWPGAST